MQWECVLFTGSIISEQRPVIDAALIGHQVEFHRVEDGLHSLWRIKGEYDILRLLGCDLAG
jgi:hypothetical protein